MPRNDLHTIGRISERLNRSPGHVERMIQAMQIEPVWRLNGTPYYCTEDETAIDQAIRQELAERILGRSIPQEQTP